MFNIEVMLEEQDDTEVHKVGKVVTRGGKKAKSAETVFGSYAEIIQVSDSINM